MVWRGVLRAPRVPVRKCRPARWVQEVRRLAGLPPRQLCAPNARSRRCLASGQEPVQAVRQLRLAQAQQPVAWRHLALARSLLRPWERLARVRWLAVQIFWRQLLPALSILEPVGFQRLGPWRRLVAAPEG